MRINSRRRTNGFTVLELQVAGAVCALLLCAVLAGKLYLSADDKLVVSESKHFKRACEFAYSRALETGKRSAVRVDQKNHRILVETNEQNAVDGSSGGQTAFQLDRGVSVEAGPADGSELARSWMTEICAFGDKDAKPRKVRLWDAFGHEVSFRVDGRTGTLSPWQNTEPQ